MSSIFVAVAGLTALAYIALALVAVRRPLLTRLALREAVRRPWQSAIVIGGLMIGTGAMLGPHVHSDSATDSLVAAAHRSWGRVDLTVSGGGGYFFSPAVAHRLAADPNLGRWVAGVQAGLELTGSVTDVDRRLGKPTVSLIGFDPTTQPAFGAYVPGDGRRTYGQELVDDQVVLSRSLADSLGMLAEGALTATVGVAIGMAVGLEASHLFVSSLAQNVPIANVNLGEAGVSLAVLYGSVMLLTLAITAGPALRTSRVAPAEALRLVD